MKIDYKAIGIRIKMARLRKGLSQEQLAERIGRSAQHISNIETGKAKFGFPILMAIANELNVTSDDLLYDRLRAARSQLENEFLSIVTDCDTYELRMICDTISALKESMRQNTELRNRDLVENVD